MSDSLLFILATVAGAASMTPVFLVLLCWTLPRSLSSAMPWQGKAHDALLVAAYALFPVHVLTNLLGVGGMFGDGATSMFRAVTPFTLLAVPSTQIALFVVCFCLRFTVFRGSGDTGWPVALIPAIIPTSYVILWAV